jgi:tRNA (adenine57-N1/adenine58-N1)-methyltransferase
MLQPGQLVLLVSPKGKRYLRQIGKDDVLQTGDGVLDLAQVAEAGYGVSVRTHLGRPFKVVKPTLYNIVKGVKRQTQIIYPKEIGYIMLKLGVGPGARIIEAGSGSGSLTLALAWFVGPHGKVYTHERRPEFTRLCRRNLAWAGLDDGRVEQIDRDIAQGFAHAGADALFLDVRTPWEYLEHIPAAVTPGAPLGFLLPTVNQVSDLVAGLEAGPFGDIEVLEIMLRRYKPVADRLRPEDRMVAHTGFLVFARLQEPAPGIADAPDNPESPEAPVRPPETAESGETGEVEEAGESRDPPEPGAAEPGKEGGDGQGPPGPTTDGQGPDDSG